MTNAWFMGAASSVPQDENEVRSTVEPIRSTSDTAEKEKAPEFNEVDTDESGELVGLAPRVVGSATTEDIQYAPWWASLSTAPHNELIDRQVATSGTAAAREAAGQAGHGTMQYAEGIEPVIREGAAFGNEYFVSNDQDIQEGAGSYMAAATADNWHAAIAQSVATERSRQAFLSTQYGAFLGGG